MIEPSTTFLSDVKQNLRRRRAVALGVVLLAFVVMGWYAVTDSTHLAHDLALTGGDYVGAALCHRITSRTFMINGRQLPLCARCTGEFYAAGLTLLFQAFVSRRKSRLPSRGVLAVLFLFFLAFGIDGAGA